MDRVSCNVVYLDNRIRLDRLETRKGPQILVNSNDTETHSVEEDEVRSDLEALLSVFPNVYACSSSNACLRKLKEFESGLADAKPTLIFIDVRFEHQPRRPSRYLSVESTESSPPENDDLQNYKFGETDEFYGLPLLKHIRLEISNSNLSKLNVPFGVLHQVQNGRRGIGPMSSYEALESAQQSETARGGVPLSNNVTKSSRPTADCPVDVVLKLLETGATDVIQSPFGKERVERLLVHGYRAYVDGAGDRARFNDTRRARKRSWVGVDEQKPYAYLRESMVSSLMNSICKPDSAAKASEHRAQAPPIEPARAKYIEDSIGSWAFPAHEFSEDELVHAGFFMLQHAMRMPELEKWRISSDELMQFLIGCRLSYNSFVLYHNFRHVIDVLQAVFFFLLQLEILPPFPVRSSYSTKVKPQSPIAALLKPFDAFVLLIAAIGHDVGHPGVNNAFLVALKAPLAQLYNDNSVLEAFHCAAYSQILRRHWRVAFDDTDVRKVLIKSILATDMQVHFKYMADLGNLQDKLHHNKGTDGWSVQVLEEYRALACGLLIKCADISNVVRPFKIAARWSDILQLEFARQGEMERDVGIPTTLFGGPPELGNVIKLANSQIGFMNIFALPLFESVSDVLPGLEFAVKEIKSNLKVWEAKIEEEKAKEESKIEPILYTSTGFQSPRSGSPVRMFQESSEMSHPEGLPASESPPPLSEPHLPERLQKGPEKPAETGHSALSDFKLGEVPRGKDSEVHIPESSTPTPGTRSPAVFASEPSRHSSSTFPLTDISNASRAPGSSRPGQSSSDSANRSSIENTQSSQPDVSTSSSNEAVLLDSASSTSTAPITFSSAVETPIFSAHKAENGSEYSTGSSHVTPNNNNFSRPLSGRHSGQASTGRSSGHSAAPVPVPQGEKRGPNSFHAAEGSGRPSSSYSSVPTESAISVGVKTSPSRDPKMSFSSRANGHSDGERAVRRKGSRFRFDFWKKKKSGEVSP